MRFPRFDFADPASTDFEARCFRSTPTGLLLSWPENGQCVVETAQGTLIGALPNYHVGSELALRLLEEFVSPARINTTPRPLLNRRHYEPPSEVRHVYPNVCTRECTLVCTMCVETKYEHSKLNSIYIVSVSAGGAVCFGKARLKSFRAFPDRSCSEEQGSH